MPHESEHTICPSCCLPLAFLDFAKSHNLNVHANTTTRGSLMPKINITKLFCELHSMLLLLLTAAILNGGHIGDFSGIRTKKGKTLSFN